LTVRIKGDDSVVIKKLPLGLYEANCYILTDELSKETAVIDPGESSRELSDYISSSGAKLKYILLTHGHLDHTGAVADLMKSFDCPVCISKKDADIMRKGDFIFGQFDVKEDKVIYLEDGTVLKIGDIEIKSIETPGHSPGGICFLAEGKLFSGDTLFSGSIGRTDFNGGDYNVLISSIRNKLMILSDNTEVYPGHGPQTAIKWEKTGNPFLKNR
jgi:hydroxyacylglutathione hydrolase